MDNSRPVNDSLFNLSLNELCQSMDKETMRKLLDDYPPKIILKVIWKMLQINNGDHELLRDRTLYYIEKYEETFNEGCVVAHLLINIRSDRPLWDLGNRILRFHEQRHEIYVEDKLNFCKQFNPDIFFKFMKVDNSECKVFVIFQICVQENGVMFPKQFAEMWIKEIETQENEININHIEQGLKLGIFLGDCGWYNESALVLSYTYKMISTKWVCSDLNKKQIRSVQCLTKWLLVVTYYNDFDEAVVVLSRMLCNIGLLESEGNQGDKESQSYLANAYLAVSEYYYEIMDYENAWIWAIKIVDKLNDESSNTLKLSVVSHFIKVGSATNRANIAKKLLVESLYTYNNTIDPKTCIDIIRNVTGYQIHADLIRFTISSFLISIGWSRHLFGYCNLYTAKLMVDYARERYGSNFTELTDIKHAMSSVVQGIYIMEKVGVPNNNMLLVNARLTKSSILQLLFASSVPSLLTPIDTATVKFNNFMKSMVDTETCFKKSLDISIKLFGKNSPYVARRNYNMGVLYQNQLKYVVSMSTHINILELNALIENEGLNAQNCKKHLRYMNYIQKDKLGKAKICFLEAKSIYEAVYGAKYFWLAHVYRRLTEVTKFRRGDYRLEEYMKNVLIMELNLIKVDRIHKINGLDIKDYVCLENFKRIIDYSKLQLVAMSNPFSP